jgi:RNA polymerase sigma factor (sigma-70 family)
VAHRRYGPPPAIPGPSASSLALRTALARLPIEQRTTLVLFYLCDLSVADVARETGVAEGTVKARLFRGRRALAQLLDIDLSEDTHV